MATPDPVVPSTQSVSVTRTPLGIRFALKRSHAIDTSNVDGDERLDQRHIKRRRSNDRPIKLGAKASANGESITLQHEVDSFDITTQDYLDLGPSEFPSYQYFQDGL